jgi:hypothetical protein
MPPLFELIQTHSPDCQHKEDTDRESRKNGPNPIRMSNHGIQPFGVVSLRVYRIVLTLAAIPDVNLTVRPRLSRPRVACR